MSASKCMYYNQDFDRIKKYSFYSAREKDDTWYGFHPTERLMVSNRFWNTQEFGGPFSCNKNKDGSYLEYKLPNPNYFVGKDSNHNTCIKSSEGTCQCQYYDDQRKFPITWRCRPWYKASIQNAYVTFADAYSDINTGSLITTCSFKIVDQQNNGSINQESSSKAEVVQSIDLSLASLQNMYGQGDLNSEYSYLVAPLTINYDTDIGYYNYTAFYHPLMNGTKQTILNLEFDNSTNKEEEIQEFIEKTQFMLDKEIRQNGCDIFKKTTQDESNETDETNLQQQDDDTNIQYITRNGTEFYTIFTTIKVCYGNLEEQKNLKIGYLAKAISVDRKYEITNTLRNNLKSMQIAIILTLVFTFFGCFILLYFCLLKFLKYNFEEPIQILSTVIKDAGPYEIHQLHKSIQQGEIRTQYELKNLLSAINSVVIGVQTKLQQDLDKNSKNEEQQQISIFRSALNTFQTVDHRIGMGMCYNNIGNIYMRKGEFRTALALYKQAFILSQEEYIDEANLQKQKDQLNGNETFLIDFTKKNFMRIYASRKYQIGCTLLKTVINNLKLLDGQDLQFQQTLILDQNQFINKTENILSDQDLNFKSECNNLIKNTTPDQIQNQILQDQVSLASGDRNNQNKPSFQSIFDNIRPEKSNRIRKNKSKCKTEVNLDDIDSKRKQISTLNDLQIQSSKSSKKRLTLPFNTQRRQSNDKPQNQINPEVQKYLLRKQSTSKIKQNGLDYENIFSLRFYNKVSQKYKLDHSNENDNSQFKNEFSQSKTDNNFSDNKSFLMQAYDLFFDAKGVFDKLGDYCSQNSYYEAYEYYSLSILCFLKLAHCQLLLGQRNFLVKELLQKAKDQIKIKIFRFNQLITHSLHQDVLIGKYYLMKARLNMQEEQYAKSLKKLLQCLNYNYNIQSIENEKKALRYSDNRLHFYDPLDTQECLELIKLIISKEKINFSAYQKQQIDRDQAYVQSAFNDQSEPYFFEVFFKETQSQTQLVEISNL